MGRKELMMWMAVWCVVAVAGQNTPHSMAPTQSPWTNPKFLQCAAEYIQVLEPKDIVHIEMLDYSGKAYNDLGNYDGCRSLNASIAQYCLALAQVPVGKANANVGIYLGLCAPTQCDADTIQQLIVVGLNFPPYNISTRFPIQEEIDSLTIYCEPSVHPLQFSAAASVALVMCLVIALLVIAGTVIEYVEEKPVVRPKEQPEDRKSLLADVGNDDGRRDTLPEPLAPVTGGINVHPTDSKLVYVPYDKRNRNSKLYDVVKSFAIGANMKWLLQDNRGNELGLAAMNGLRVVMMAWIILGHTLTYLSSPIGFDNDLQIEQNVIERVSFQVVSAAELAVDVFFYISGFLVVYMVLKEMKSRRESGIPWGLFYFHRYWRLTPVYAAIIFIYATLTPHMIYGPFAHLYRGAKTDLCDKYWWSNLLYINNFYPTNSNDQCLGWGWYLANDMQFFIFTPIIVLLFKRSRKLAWALLVSLISVCLILNATLTYTHHLEPLNPGDSEWNTIVYNKPYTRMAPYIIGIGFALLVQYDIDLAANWKVRWAGYIIGGTFTTCATYLTYGFWRGTGWVVWQNVVYATFARVAFVLGVGWFMYACYKQHGGVLRRILSLYVWVPLARLTYTAYLTHPITMFVINFSSTTVFHFSGIYTAVRYSSHLFLAYAVGLVFYLAIEKPTANLERVLLPTKKKN